jgi:hypothetical protein
VLDQSPASLHEPLLQAGQRPRRQFSSAAGGDATGCPDSSSGGSTVSVLHWSETDVRGAATVDKFLLPTGTPVFDSTKFPMINASVPEQK